MGKLSRLVLFLLAIVPLFTGIREANFVVVPPVPFQEINEEHTGSYLSERELTKTFCLHRFTGNVVHSVNNLPAPDSKTHSNHFLFASVSFEKRMQNIASQYLLHSKEIDQSLSIGDIIFPFHYFW